uniref:YadA-like family protein n=1 Tax=Megasphaera sp. TaxID=2023260 RepID=UPI00257F47E8
NVIVGKTPDGKNDALIIQMKKAPSFTTVYAGTPDAQGVHPVSVGQVTVTRDGKTETVDGVVITDGPMITKDGINNHGKQITHLKSGGIYNEEDKKYHYDDEVGTNAATIQDVKNISSAAAQSEVEAQKVTVSGVDDNITVTSAADNPNHYQVQLSNTLKLGQDSKSNPNIRIDGQNGKVTVGSGSTGNNSVVIDGNGGTVTIGNGTSGHKKVTISGNDGTMTGLTNKTWDANNIISGRAATEDQLKQAVSDAKQAAQQNDTHVKANTYKVSDDHKVSLDVVDGTGAKKGSVVIDNVAKATDIGDISNIDEDIRNKENNNIVDSLNNLNKKIQENSGNVQAGWTSKIDGVDVKTVTPKDKQNFQNFESGDNIQLSNDKGAIQITTKKDVSFDKVTIGSGDSQMTLDKDGLQAGKVKVSSEGINAGGNRIQGVADGKKKDDAATVGQVAQVADAAGTAINTLGNHINRLDRRINKVGAGAAALAALHPDPNSDDDLSFSAGIGNYRGSTAAAIGAFYRPSDNVTVSMGATVGNGENMVNAGVTIGVGEGVGRNPSTRKDMIREISQLKEANAAKEAEVCDLKKQVQTLQKQNEDTQEKLKRIMEKLGI